MSETACLLKKHQLLLRSYDCKQYRAILTYKIKKIPREKQLLEQMQDEDIVELQ